MISAASCCCLACVPVVAAATACSLCTSVLPLWVVFAVPVASFCLLLSSASACVSSPPYPMLSYPIVCRNPLHTVFSTKLPTAGPYDYA